MLARHEVISADEAKVSPYNARRRVLDSHWQELIGSGIASPNEIAATLHLWADEAGKFGYRYDL